MTEEIEEGIEDEIPVIEETGDPEKYLIRKKDGTLVTPEVYYKELSKKIATDSSDKKDNDLEINFDL